MKVGGCLNYDSFVINVYVIISTGAKAIGTAWTIAPSQEEESIWGGKTLTKGIAL